MVKSKENLIGAYAFLIGIIFAVIMGFLQTAYNIKANSLPYAFLMILGIIVGSLNLGDKDSLTFLLASLSIVIVSGFGQSALIYVASIPILSSMSAILYALLMMFVPATIIVALKTVFSIASV